MSHFFPASDARRIDRQIARGEATPHNLLAPRPSPLAPAQPTIEGRLLDALAAPTGPKQPTTARFQIYRGAGSGWAGAETVTVTNRDNQFSQLAGSYLVCEWINGLIMPIPASFGRLIDNAPWNPLNCDPFDCVYPSYPGSTGCDPTAYSWSVYVESNIDFPPALVELLPTGPCTWAGTGYYLGLMTLVVSATGLCTLTETIDGVVVARWVKAANKWCPTCDNEMLACPSGIAHPVNTTIPKLCVKPRDPPQIPCTAACPDVPYAWLLTASGFGGGTLGGEAACCAALNGKWVLDPVVACYWRGPDIAACFCAGGGFGNPASHGFWSLSMGGSPSSPSITVSVGGNPITQPAITCVPISVAYIANPAKCLESQVVPIQFGTTGCGGGPATVKIDPL